MPNGENERPGSDGRKLFSRMSSSTGRKIVLDTDFMPPKTRGRSLCEHLKRKNV